MFILRPDCFARYLLFILIQAHDATPCPCRQGRVIFSSVVSILFVTLYYIASSTTIDSYFSRFRLIIYDSSRFPKVHHLGKTWTCDISSAPPPVANVSRILIYAYVISASGYKIIYSCNSLHVNNKRTRAHTYIQFIVFLKFLGIVCTELNKLLELTPWRKTFTRCI